MSYQYVKPYSGTGAPDLTLVRVGAGTSAEDVGCKTTEGTHE